MAEGVSRGEGTWGGDLQADGDGRRPGGGGTVEKKAVIRG